MVYTNGTTAATVASGTKPLEVASIAVSEITEEQTFFDDRVGITPNALEDVPDLISQVASLGISYIGNTANEQTRATLLDTARSLVTALETPREAIIRYCWSQATSYAALETGVDLGLFIALSKDDTPKTATELAEATGADAVMLARICKHLSAVGVIKETGPDTYRRTGVSTSLMQQRYSDAYPCISGCIHAGVYALPTDLKKTNYRNPSDGTNCAFQIGYKTEKHFFDYLKEHPDHAMQFNNHMSVYHQGRPSWMDVGFYPVPKLVQGVDITENDALIVDMGGSVGHDLSEFQRKWPSLPGRLILQDLPEVIEQAKGSQLHPSIELMVHDFFTEQPIKGARAYYMHSILHDWTDDNCRKILSNIASAMKRGHSKVLINENVIPDTNAYWETTSLDLIMMSCFASTERTERHWHSLVESAGLKITKIWTARRGVESLIECELA